MADGGGLLSGLPLRVPPQNLEAEQALLGALLANNKAHDRVGDFLRAEHFADPAHGRIYAALTRRIEQGELVNAVTLKSDLEQAGQLAEVGGTAYLAQLVSTAVGIVNAGEYGRVIHHCHLRRELIDLGAGIVNAAFGDSEGLDAPQQIAAAEAKLFSLAIGGTVERRVQPAASALSAAVSRAEEAARSPRGLVGTTYGFASIDAMTAGARPGQFILIGARPGMGKTALGLSIALRAAAGGQRVLFRSIEMTAEELGVRLAAMLAGLDTMAMLRGRVPAEDRLGDGDGTRPLGQDEYRRLIEAQRELAALADHQGRPCLVIDDTPEATLAQIRTSARRMQRHGGLDLVVIDYMDKIEPSERIKRAANRYSEMSEVSSGVKNIARRLNIPILALHQLSRRVEQREDKRPLLSDLRDSGVSEQEADVVMFLYRQEYYLRDNQPVRKAGESDGEYGVRESAWHDALNHAWNRAELGLAKNRQGRTGKIDLFCYLPMTAFYDPGEWAGVGPPPHPLGGQRRQPCPQPSERRSA
jgi:replicative DNA helicase